ncbi:4Fe-4S dicluster domain-containing protein [Dryocola sp. BD613]|uniref:4Fe-4S dicluster domain-containing protein n=1 Tax=Dryocola sp. BD613 TaxID=3133272 RepID=UPI003F50A3E1
MTDFILADPQRCIACRTCEIACAQAHASPGCVSKENFFPRLTVNKLSRASAPVMCHQCENAPCISACPTRALTMGKHAVLAESALCIGCRSCMVACPFGCILIEASPLSGMAEIIKCDLCASREAGPACVEVCPTFALQKIEADKLQSLQEERIKKTARGAFSLRI